MSKRIADMEYSSEEKIEKKSAFLLIAMNKCMSALRDYLKRYSDLEDTCKAEEVARLLGISVKEVWLKASKGELTPCLQLTNQTMYAIKELNPIGLVLIGGLFTLSKGAISDWFSRGTGSFSTNMFFPIRLDSILDESWMGDVAADRDSLKPPMFLWKDAPLETADKFQMAVSVDEPTDRTIHLDDFLYLREQVKSLVVEVTHRQPTDEGGKQKDELQVTHDIPDVELDDANLEDSENTLGTSEDITSNMEKPFDDIPERSEEITLSSEDSPTFDPVSLSGIASMFPLNSDPDMNLKKWRNYASKASENGLIKSRLSIGSGTAESTFDPELVGDWVQTVKDTIYNIRNVNRILAMNLPKRSEDKREFFLYDTEDFTIR